MQIDTRKGLALNMKSDETDERHLADPAPTSHGGRVELRLLRVLSHAVPSGSTEVDSATNDGAAPTSEGASSDASTEAPSREVFYQARWFAADGKWTGEARVTPPAHGKRSHAVFVTAPADLPAWLAQFTETLLKTTARAATAEGGAWPRRLTRWRDAPRDP